jgi:hypothetical protein
VRRDIQFTAISPSSIRATTAAAPSAHANKASAGHDGN